MANQIKIRATLKGDIASISALIRHPMETGMRKDAGKLVPAKFIQVLTVEVAGKTVVNSHLNTAVSADPVFGFKVKGAKAGDKVVVNWVDNQGEKGSGEAVIAAA